MQIEKMSNQSDIYDSHGHENVDLEYTDFDTIWVKYIKPLEGSVVSTATGSENIICSVTGDYLQRKSSAGNISCIDKKIFKNVYLKLLDKKKLTRKEIHDRHPSRVSSIVTAVLARVPFIELSKKRPITLMVKSKN